MGLRVQETTVRENRHPNRILILVTNLTFGGAEAQVVRLAGELKARDWEVAVVSLVEPEAHLAQLEKMCVSHFTLRMKKRIPDPRAVLRLSRLIREFQPGVVHCHMFHANILGRICRIITRIPVLVCTVHNLRETSERGGPTWYKELLYRLTDRLADTTTIVCQAGFERHVKVGAVPASRLRVMPNFVDTDRFSPDSTRRQKARRSLGLGDEFVWLAVGRLVRQKDYPNLLCALHALGAEGMKLLIAGAGQLLPEIQAMSRELDLESKVRFCGTSEDILDLYNAADAFVMSSQFEGLSVALLEAASMELPAVVTDVGGNSEIVQHADSGFLVPAEDSAALAEAMQRMMKLSVVERAEMGQGARRRCRLYYDSRIVVQKWIDLYDQALDGRNSCPARPRLSPHREAEPVDRQAS